MKRSLLLAARLLAVAALLPACSPIGGGEPRSGDESRGEGDSAAARTGDEAGSCARPYSDASPWNTPIGREARYEARSELYVAEIEGPLTSDPTQYTYPVYRVAADAPLATVEISGWFSNVTDGGRRLENQREGTVEVPVPAGAEAAAGSDAQIILLDPETGDEWGFWQLERDEDGDWSATNGYHYNTRWSGVPPRDEEGRPFISRGAGVPYLTGLVRPCELARDRIEHALAFAYDAPTSDHVYPATKSDGNGEDPFDLPEGARLQLDPEATPDEIRSWGCTGPCYTIARALQRYGMYVIDNSGRSKVMLEYEGTARWNGVVDEATVSAIPVSELKVLELPQP